MKTLEFVCSLLYAEALSRKKIKLRQDDRKMLSKNRLFRFVFLYTIIPVTANLIAVMLLSKVIAEMVNNPATLDLLGFRDADALLMILSTFLPPVVLILGYLLPVFKMLMDGDAGSNPTGARRLLNAPLIVGLSGILGWLISLVFTLVNTLPHIDRYPFEQQIRIPMLQLLSGFLCFVFSYHLLDIVNRRLFIPDLFPDGKLLKVPGLIRLSLRAKFFILFITVCFFPVFLLFNVAYARFAESGDLNGISNMGLMAAGILLTGGVVTRMIGRSYQHPLKRLQQAADLISSGDYQIQLPVLSSDEIGCLGNSVNRMAAGLLEKEFIKDTFGKMVAPEVRDYLLAGNLSLGGELRQSAILFSDIRSFTAISEQLEPQQIVAMLNRYFAGVSNCITANRGTVNKYIGDAVMGLFGVPLKSTAPADDALTAAVQMQQALTGLNEVFAEEHMPYWEHGIGIHYGEVLAGNIGSPDRMEYTVIGDPVNVTARIESATKRYRSTILLSDTAVQQLQYPGKYKLREIDIVLVKGKEQPVTLYECFSADPPQLAEGKERTGHIFKDALQLYRAGAFSEAEKKFQDCQAQLPGDGAVRLYLNRCLLRKQHNLAGDWTGITDLTSEES